VFNDLVFTPQVASHVEAELRRNGIYIYTCRYQNGCCRKHSISHGIAIYVRRDDTRHHATCLPRNISFGQGNSTPHLEVPGFESKISKLYPESMEILYL